MSLSCWLVFLAAVLACNNNKSYYFVVAVEAVGTHGGSAGSTGGCSRFSSPSSFSLANTEGTWWHHGDRHGRRHSALSWSSSSNNNNNNKRFAFVARGGGGVGQGEILSSSAVEIDASPADMASSSSTGKDGMASSSSDYTAVSTVVWGAPSERNSQTFLPGCQLTSDTSDDGVLNWVGRGTWYSNNDQQKQKQKQSNKNQNTPALWKTLAFLSDVVVLVLHTRDPIDLDLVNALEAGFQARTLQQQEQQQDRDDSSDEDLVLSKGRLLIVLHGDYSQEEVLEWKNHLTSTLEGSAPRIVEELVIVPASDYATALQQMKRKITTQRRRLRRRHRNHHHHRRSSSNGAGAGVEQGGGGVCQLADAETFPSLVQQVHRAFGGGNVPLLESTALESLVVVQQQQVLEKEKEESVKRITTAQQLLYDQEMEAKLLTMANDLLDELQLQQENIWLDQGNKQQSRPRGAGIGAGTGQLVMPINFARKVNPILSKLEKEMKKSSKDEINNVVVAMSATVRDGVIRHVRARIRILYQQQLESLRDYHGKLYETTLERTVADSNNKNNNDDNNIALRWKEAATRTTEKFRKAAQNAVPNLVRPGKVFEDLDLNYYRSLAESGLISDMMEATDLRQQDPENELLLSEEDDSYDENGPSSSSSSSAASRKRKRWTKWYEKLAARALVIGVNYLQGWLAWQGIKRAALLREQQMPKFPLF